MKNASNLLANSFLLLCVLGLIGCQSVETFTLPGGVPLTMVDIPAGTFMMGSDNGLADETPVHSVTLSQDFQLGQTEVTKAQWEAVMETTPWSGQANTSTDPDSPAVYVSWEDAQDFIVALNNLTGETFRLPTEAEWEYGCRAGTATEYYFGDSSATLSDYARWSESNNGYADLVAQLLPNAFGLYDTHGNVFEWCEDWYDPGYYSVTPSSDPPGPESGSDRVFRGGGWNDSAFVCRSAFRGRAYPATAGGIIGFRLAK